jgi:chromatin modification-related protein EAF6
MTESAKRKKELRKELVQIEKQIYDLETTYLEETKEFGNIFTGWDAYLSKEKIKQKKTIFTEDRLFSLSSFTSPASKREELKNVNIYF